MSLLEELKLDLRQAIRVLLQSKGWTATAILTLALGIAPATALFALIDHVYSPIAVDHPNDLVFGVARDMDVYAMLANHNSTLSGVLAFGVRYRDTNHVVLVSNYGVAPAEVEYVSGNYFRVLGISAIRGRTIQEDDDSPLAPPVAMISELYWEREFGRNSNVVGQTIEFNQKEFRVVGVWPKAFVHASGEIQRYAGQPIRPDVMVPLVHRPEPNGFLLVGRKKPGVTLSQVNADIGRLRLPDDIGWRPRPFKEHHYGFGGIVDQFRERFVSTTLTALLIAGFFAVPLVLSCANIATFLAARAEDRRAEIALRLSLGASRERLIRQTR